MVKLLSRSALLSAKLPTRDVPVPEMGLDAVVRVQQMSVNTRAEYLERIRQHTLAEYAYEDDQALPVADRKGVAKPADLDNAVLCIVHSLVDEEGNTLFTEQDMPLFNSWSNSAVTRIFQTCIDLNQYDVSTTAKIEAEKKD